MKKKTFLIVAELVLFFGGWAIVRGIPEPILETSKAGIVCQGEKKHDLVVRTSDEEVPIYHGRRYVNVDEFLKEGDEMLLVKFKSSEVKYFIKGTNEQEINVGARVLYERQRNLVIGIFVAVMLIVWGMDKAKCTEISVPTVDAHGDE